MRRELETGLRRLLAGTPGEPPDTTQENPAGYSATSRSYDFCFPARHRIGSRYCCLLENKLQPELDVAGIGNSTTERRKSRTFEIQCRIPEVGGINDVEEL